MTVPSPSTITRSVWASSVGLAVTTMVDDPQYLALPYVKTYQYKKQADAAGWAPTPCVAR